MRTSTRQSYEERIQEVVDHVLGSLDGPLDVDALADRACFSRWHFSRVFAGMVGETLLEFVRRIRLERSALELLRDGKAITVIAFEAGYATHEAFSKAFRAAYGANPSEFRAARPREHRLPAPCGVHFAPEGARQAFVPRLEGGRTMEATFKKMPALRAVCLRHVGPYHMIGAKFGELCEWAARTGAPAGQAIAFYHDDPETTPPNEMRSDAGMLVPPDYATDDPSVHIVDIPPKEYAVCTHVGPYDGLGATWAEFAGEWFPASGREMEGSICFELYVDDPTTTAPEALRTELYEAVKPL